MDQHEYDRDTLFTPAVLGQLKPDQIVQWMQKKVYRTLNPGLNNHPVHGCSSSLEYYKKAISHYMPNKLISWNALMEVGNPIHSMEINNLIKKVKKAEVQKLGKKSSAWCPLKKAEYHALLRILGEKDDFQRKVRYTAFIKFHFHLIGRADTANFEMDDLKENSDFVFTLLGKMCWSKNVLEERDAPDQILIGAMDPDYCILMALAVYLEYWMEHGDGIHSKYLFCDDINDDAPKQTKDSMHSTVKRDVYDNPDFE